MAIRKVLVIGAGGREHALCRKLKEDSYVYCIPGNAGIAAEVEVDSIDPNNFNEVEEFIRRNNINLTVIGPEKFLDMGISDFLEEKGHRCFGTGRKASRLESSKIYAKEFMRKAGIPTSNWEVYNTKEALIAAIKKSDFPMVLKADSLAAGKGVVIAKSKKEALLSVDFLFSLSDTIIVEDYVSGTEASIMCFVDNQSISLMPAARDYKRIFEADRGPNTGGMGAFAPDKSIPTAVLKSFEANVSKPFMKAIQAEKIDFRGVLFVGIMYDESGQISVLEFNTRFGDPETEVVLPLLKDSLYDILYSVTENKLIGKKISWKNKYVTLIVSAAKGYPNKPITGDKIDLSDLPPESIIHFGTQAENGVYYTAGGRVIGALGMGRSLNNARDRAYLVNQKINFEGRQFRKDIAVL